MTEPFRFSNGQQANNVEDLIKICQESPQEGINYLKRGDLENWLTYIGELQLAKYAQQARESSIADEEQLHQFLTSCQVKQRPETSVPVRVTSSPEPSKTAPPEPSRTPGATNGSRKSAPEPEPANPIAKLFQGIANLFSGKK